MKKMILKKYLDTINRQIVDIKKLLDEFSSFARMPRPIFKKIDINKEIKRVVEFYKMSHKRFKFQFCQQYKK